MTTTLICAGGSGARVLESVLHLCAAGLGPSSLRTFVIDPDDANGNVGKTRELVNTYEKCHKAFRDNQQPFFRTGLDLLNSPQGLRVWRPVNKNQRFKDVLNFSGLSHEKQDVVRLLFTEQELDMEMQVGFRGHPALGAAALSLLPLYTNDELWSQFTTAIRQDLSLGEVRIVIVGSIFGGTGASTIHPLVRYLRSLPQNNHANLKIAAVALAPYFQFNAAEAKVKTGKQDTQPAAKSELFPLASRSAAEYYEHLRQNNEWDFDAMYWLGDDSPVKVEYSPGGIDQKNPAHFVDLLAAFAALDFFEQPPPANSCYYAGPLTDPGFPDGNVLTWDDIPMMEGVHDRRRYTLHRFHLMGCAHLGFYAPLLSDPRLQNQPRCVPWYNDRFRGQESLAGKDNADRLKALTSYFKDFYFPWCDEIHAAGQNRVRLLNRTAWRNGKGGEISIQTDRFGNLWYPDIATRQGRETVDELFNQTVRCAPAASVTENMAGLYFSILGSAAEVIVKKEYADPAAQERRG